MADSLSSIGSIATHLYNSFTNIPLLVSGNLVQIADLARQHVANYVGTTIGSNSIADVYQPAIVDFAKADTLDILSASPNFQEVSLDQLSIGKTEVQGAAEQYRMLAEKKLALLGRKVYYAKSIS